MVHATIPALIAIAILGALVYGLSTNGKAGRLGEIAYAAGLLVAVWYFAQVTVSLP